MVLSCARIFVTEIMELDTSAINFVLPTFPFLVVIKITPFAPLEPYIAVASASFKTSMVAIVEGSNVFKGFIIPP